MKKMYAVNHEGIAPRMMKDVCHTSYLTLVVDTPAPLSILLMNITLYGSVMAITTALWSEHVE